MKYVIYMIPVIIFLFIFLIFIVSICIDLQMNTNIKEGGNDNTTIINIKFLYDKCKKLFENKKFKPICRYSELKSIPYKDYKNLRFGCHMGQRKLLLSELQFYSDYPTNLVVYAGSAPCIHLSMILELFPKMKFILIDPNYHNFDYEFQYIYQNFDSISDDNKKIMLDYMNDKDSVYYNNIFRQTQSKTLENIEFNAFKKESYDWKNNMKNFYDHKINLSELLQEDCRVFVIQDYMNIELCKEIKRSINDIGNLNFVSDLRTNMFENYPTDLDIIWNDSIQAACIDILKPEYSLLKFHPPYFNSDDNSVFDFIKHSNNSTNEIYKIISANFEYIKDNMNIDSLKEYKNKKYKYLKSEDIYLQAWAPRSSTETRLIIKGVPDSSEYNPKEWDNKFTFQKNLRMYGYFNYFYDIVKNYKSSNVINDYNANFDSMLEIYILLNYIYKTKMDYKKFNKKIDLDKLFDLKYKIDEHLNYTISDRCFMPILCIPKKINMYYNSHGKSYNIRNPDKPIIISENKKINEIYKLIEC